MQATKAWAEANPLEPCECGVVDGTIVIIVYTAGLYLGLESLRPSLAPPNEVNTDEHAKTKKMPYFNATNDNSFDIKTYRKRTSETVGTN